MKIKRNMIYRNIAGEHILVPAGEAVTQYSGVFVVTETGARIWELLGQGKEEDAVIAALLDEFDVDEATLRSDYNEFIAVLRKNDLIEE